METMDEIWRFYDLALVQPESDAGKWGGRDQFINLTDVWETIDEARARELRA